MEKNLEHQIQALEAQIEYHQMITHPKFRMVIGGAVLRANDTPVVRACLIHLLGVINGPQKQLLKKLLDLENSPQK